MTLPGEHGVGTGVSICFLGGRTDLVLLNLTEFGICCVTYTKPFAVNLRLEIDSSSRFYFQFQDLGLGDGVQ
jgi:hypothetical protein